MLLTGAAMGVWGLASCASLRGSTIRNPWAKADAIVESLRRTSFPDRVVNIRDLGAEPGTDARPAIMQAIKDVAAEGGGRVVIPAGLWLSDGPIHLESNIDLHLEEGAHLQFLPNPESYLPPVFTRWEGTEVFTYSPFIFAQNKTNVALTGKGKIDGQGEEYWMPWRENQRPIKKVLRDMGRDGVPVEERVFVGERRLRPYFVQFHGCEQVLVEDIEIVDSPFWLVHLVYCSDVIVRGIRCISSHINSDGVDPDSSRRVLIENCDFNIGDDGVSIKAGRDQDGWRVGRPSEDIVVRNCVFSGRAGGGVAIGSEMSGGVRNVYVDGFRLRKARHTLYFKANLDRGGMIRDVFIRNIEAGEVHAVLVFSNNYHSYRGGNFPTEFRDVYVENVRAEKAEIGISIQGNETVPVRNMTVKNMRVGEADFPLKTRHVEDITLDDVVINGRTITLADAVDVDTELIKH
jgi:polygalacturonase